LDISPLLQFQGVGVRAWKRWGLGSLTAGLQQVEQRAIAASRGKMSTVRSHNVIKSEIVRGGKRAIAGGAAR